VNRPNWTRDWQDYRLTAAMQCNSRSSAFPSARGAPPNKLRTLACIAGLHEPQQNSVPVCYQRFGLLYRRRGWVAAWCWVLTDRPTGRLAGKVTCCRALRAHLWPEFTDTHSIADWADVVSTQCYFCSVFFLRTSQSEHAYMPCLLGRFFPAGHSPPLPSNRQHTRVCIVPCT